MYISQDHEHHHSEGMLLRSGSHLKGVKHFIDAENLSRRKSTSVLNSTSAGANGISVGVHMSSSASDAVYEQHNNVGNTAELYITRTEVEEINTNNSARQTRRYVVIVICFFYFMLWFYMTIDVVCQTHSPFTLLATKHYLSI